MKSSKLPYYNTTISQEQTKAEMEKLLKDHGIKDIQWTTYKGQTELKFLHRIQIKGVEREIGFVFRPPIILIPRRQYDSKFNRYVKVNVPHDAMSYRLLWWYLKAKLEAVEYGLETVEKEFMSHILVSLPDGSQSTIGENFIGVIDSANALPAPSETEPKEKTIIIDTEKAK